MLCLMMKRMGDENGWLIYRRYAELDAEKVHEIRRWNWRTIPFLLENV